MLSSKELGAALATGRLIAAATAHKVPRQALITISRLADVAKPRLLFRTGVADSFIAAATGHGAVPAGAHVAVSARL